MGVPVVIGSECGIMWSGAHVHVEARRTCVVVKPCMGHGFELLLSAYQERYNYVEPPGWLRRKLFGATWERDVRQRIFYWQDFLGVEDGPDLSVGAADIVSRIAGDLACESKVEKLNVERISA